MGTQIGSTIRRLAARLRAERGQTIIIFALIVAPVTFAVGAVAVDAALWQSERRGAQKDADLAALAGAHELLAPTQTAGTEQAARDAAALYAELNDEAGNAVTPDKAAIDPDLANVIVVDNSCFDTSDPLLDSVVVNLDHESRTFFSEIFGIEIAPDIGAHARACMGSPIEGEGLFPMGVQVTSEVPGDSNCFEPDPDDPTGPEIPVFGQFCQLIFAASGTTSGEGGFLRLYDNGGTTCSASNASNGVNELTDEIEAGGANTTCYVAPPGTTSDDCDEAPPADWPFPYVNYCVWPKTGTFSNPIQDSFTDMLATEGDCDTKFGSDTNDYDDWLEVVDAVNGDPNPDPGDTTFVKRDCDSPRLINLVILEQFTAAGNPPRPIIAFASFYIHSCTLGGVEFRDCDVSGGAIGQTQLHGFFMNILQIGTLGQATKYGQRHITLVE